MGPKKRNRPKQFQAAASEQSVAATAASATASVQSPAAEPAPSTPGSTAPAKNESWPSAEREGGGSPSYSAVKLECERALTALRRGNHTKALRLMKELSQRHENSPHSALVHRVQGTVCVKVAALIHDQTAKNRHLRNGVESARRAVELSPNSIEFAHFYANLLYDVANEAKEYEEVVRECERALAIENPVDPGKESLQDESEQKLLTVEARIGHVHNELRQLIQKSNIASISSWMKNLGNGDPKLRLIPIRGVVDDPMEVKLVQARRPNEIKKATKTREERRKEIEVRVAAARLLQQKSELPQSENVGDSADKGLDSTSVSGQRSGDRRKAKKNGSTERRDFVRSFWNSISVDAKRELLRIRVSDIKEHFGSLMDGLANEVLLEALSFAESNRTWKFWVCCSCNEKFSNLESHYQHVVQEHKGSLSPKLQSTLPQKVDNEWIEMLLNCSWKPFDVSAAVEMLANQTRCKDSELGLCLKSCDGIFDDCLKDTSDSSLEKRNLGDSSGDTTVESTNDVKIPSIEPRECYEENRSMAFSFLSDNWPTSDDLERAKLLERIQAVFEVLIRHKCLAASHLNRVIQFTIDELQSIASGSQLLNHGVEQTPMCFCFLGASQLKKILKFLQDLSQSCGSGNQYSEKSSNLVDDANNGSQSVEIKEQIVLNGDASFLLLDESLLSAESTKEYATAATSAVDSNATGNVTDSNALLSWIFAGPSSGEELASWVHTKEEKTYDGAEILKILQKEFYHLQSLCELKSERLGYDEAVQAVEELCVDEGKRRENDREFSYQSFDSVLKKRRQELLESENDAISSQITLDAISNVLQEAETLNVNQFGYEESYGSASLQLPDLESGEDDDWRAKDYLHQVDYCVEVAIQRLKEQLYVELSKIDAQIMRTGNGMQQLEVKVNSAAAHDFQSVLLPLVKSYLRARLEDLAEKDATEKSDAIREALLAELALDSKKASKGGNDNVRHTQEKTKDKRKNKDHRKAKDSKVIGVSEPQMFHDDADESFSIPVARDGDHPDSEIVVTVEGDELNQQEEELRCRIELEADERKLEETLEYQRRIENEAKQKHLAKQQKKATQGYPEKVADGQHGENLESSPVHSGVHEQFKPSMQENLASNLEGLQIGTSNQSAPPIKSATVSGTQMTGNEHPKNILQGKRGRRQKSSAKVADGKHQAFSLRESVEVGISRVDSGLKEEDNGAKTLRQLHVDADEEERFQDDLKKAVRQSLDTFQAHKKMTSVSILKSPQRIFGEVGNSSAVPSDVQVNDMSSGGVFGTGLKNEVGEYNCFLNVIIQSLWHIRRFRDEFLQRSTSGHVHVGTPCVVCALYEIFSAMSIASTDSQREAVASTSLRTALSNLYPDSNFFREGQMNDASEVLAVIFDCFHRSFTGSSVSNTELVANRSAWDCANNACIAHSIFGMDIFERVKCHFCMMESRYLKYTSFFHNVNASALRTIKVTCSESSFDELLNLVEMNQQLACDPEWGGCGKFNYIHRTLSSPPHVFTTVMGWQNTSESIEDITATLKALNNEIDISVLYRGLDSNNKHRLVSVVCYYGQHYHSFAYSHGQGCWIMYDDNTVKVIGSWADVLSSCERGHLQPQVLFFEAVN